MTGIGKCLLRILNPRRVGGFTLVEAIIASCLFVLLIILVTSTMSFFRKTFSRSEAQSWQIQQAETFLLRASSEIRDARGISKPDFGSRGNILEFASGAGDEVLYVLSPNGVLSRQTGGRNGVRTVVENVSSVFFSRWNNNVVGVELCIGTLSPGQYHVVTSFFGRNIKP
ncbi:MAG: hypothetical protein WA705_01110 [Candidatus Ozemobacteraceae bacterium]